MPFDRLYRFVTFLFHLLCLNKDVILYCWDKIGGDDDNILSGRT